MTEHTGSLANALRALREYGFPAVTARHICEQAAYSGSHERQTATYVITVTFDRERGYQVTDNQPTDSYEIVCCGNIIAVSPAESRCPTCRSTFVVTGNR